jgi:3-oxoacyl-[acyl-carrier-protein] synthase II
MEAYINGSACISHYTTTDENYFFESAAPILPERFLSVSAPDYKKYIPANALRRTSAILKMGISSGLMALERAGLTTPDAIITGTAIGCFEDTDKFLRSIITNEEKMLNPTPFIQSTHNTVAGQIALLTGCKGYNFTYVHQNLSFETALLDALMLLEEKEAETILTGAADELNPSLEALFDHAGYIRKNSEHLSPAWEKSKGYVAGQGSVSLVLSTSPSANAIAKIVGVEMIQKIESAEDLDNKIHEFLKTKKLSLSDLQVIAAGNCGDEQFDRKLNGFVSSCMMPVVYFKNLSGEFFTAGAFGVWLAAEIIKRSKIPTACSPNGNKEVKAKNILVVNHFQDQHYSLVLLSEK